MSMERNGGVQTWLRYGLGYSQIVSKRFNRFQPSRRFKASSIL
jgi:hypothetical protein